MDNANRVREIAGELGIRSDQVTGTHGTARVVVTGATDEQRRQIEDRCRERGINNVDHRRTG